MNVFLTIDYELFLGEKTGTPENCLILPTKCFVKMLDKFNVKATVFVDAAYLLRLFQLKDTFHTLSKDYSIVCDNILELSDKGHDIELHFHPQWINSLYNSRNWELKSKQYKLSNLPREIALNSLAESKNLLESIIGRQIHAFRAGGFSLDTFDNYIQFFNNNNITIDSSVLRGEYIDSYLHSYDYRNIPNKTLYSFSSQINCEDPNGKFIELSISTFPINSIHYLIKNKFAEFIFDSKLAWGDGLGIGYGNFSNKLEQKIKKLFRGMNLSASMENFSSLLLPYVFSKFTSTIDDTNFVAIGHPKVFSQGSIQQVEKFIMKIIDSNVFMTCSDIIRNTNVGDMNNDKST